VDNEAERVSIAKKKEKANIEHHNVRQLSDGEPATSSSSTVTVDLESSSAASQPQRRKVQQKLDFSQLWSHDNPKQREATRLLGELIAAASMLYNCIEHEAFQIA